MYLTQDEFNVLSGKKKGLSNFKISQKFKMSETAVKVAFGNLLAKYDANDSSDLNEKADIKKTKVTETPPYYEYEEIEGYKRLVKKITLKEQDTTNLKKFLEKAEKQEFELIFDKDPNNFYRALYIKNTKTNERIEICSEITD